MLWIYFASFTLFLLANHARAITGRDIGSMPMPGTIFFSVYAWFGGFLATLGNIAALGWGFYAYAWWMPLVVCFFAAMVARFVFRAVPLGPLWPVIAFPAGVVAAVIAVLTYSQ